MNYKNKNLPETTSQPQANSQAVNNTNPAKLKQKPCQESENREKPLDQNTGGNSPVIQRHFTTLAIPHFSNLFPVERLSQTTSYKEACLGIAKENQIILLIDQCQILFI